eukprot:1513738-Pyramimonas_sp.AAC.1
MQRGGGHRDPRHPGERARPGVRAGPEGVGAHLRLGSEAHDESHRQEHSEGCTTAATMQMTTMTMTTTTMTTTSPGLPASPGQALHCCP